MKPIKKSYSKNRKKSKKLGYVELVLIYRTIGEELSRTLEVTNYGNAECKERYSPSLDFYYSVKTQQNYFSGPVQPAPLFQAIPENRREKWDFTNILSILAITSGKKVEMVLSV